MSDFEKFKKQLIEKSGISEFHLTKMIDGKIKRIGSGYLTKNGALLLIAADFGIILSEELEIKKISPMNVLAIPNILEKDLQKKFDVLKSDKRKKEISEALLGYGVIGIIGGILIPITTFISLNVFSLASFILSITILIFSAIGIVMSKKFSRKNLNSKERIFLEFYKVRQKMQEYGIREYKQDMSKYVSVVYDLAYFIQRWTRSFSPSIISELPDTISSNLKNMVVPQFKENNANNIKHFKTILEKVTMFCYDQEPTAELLRAFNDEISSYEIKENVKEINSLRNKLGKLILIAPISGIILFLILHNADPLELHASIGYSVTLSALILIGVLTIRNKK